MSPAFAKYDTKKLFKKPWARWLSEIGLWKVGMNLTCMIKTEQSSSLVTMSKR